MPHRLLEQDLGRRRLPHVVATIAHLDRQDNAGHGGSSEGFRMLMPEAVSDHLEGGSAIWRSYRDRRLHHVHARETSKSDTTLNRSEERRVGEECNASET